MNEGGVESLSVAAEQTGGGSASPARRPVSFEALVREDRRLRAFNDTVPAAILIVAIEDGRVLFSNRFFDEVLGLDGAGILGSGWSALFADPAEREQLLVRFVEDGEVRNFELRLRRADGSIVWGLASMAEIPIEGEDLLLFAFVDITALKEAQEEIRRLAHHDHLTGLVTVRLFRDLVEEARRRALRDQTEFAVLFIDLDRFKAVNDGLGHDAGDRVLKGVAERLLACVRTTDTVARVGGDEFVVLAERVSARRARAIGARIVSEMARPFILPEAEIRIGASVGVALFPRHGDSLEGLLKSADLAMYGVKRSTRGALAFAGPPR